jgi:uncharacterized protein YrzB (UPF0473 family)
MAYTKSNEERGVNHTMCEDCNTGNECGQDCSCCEPSVDVITLVDEEGFEHEFEVADIMEMNGTHYMALIPAPDSPEELLDDPGELVVLKVVANGAEEYLEAIEDEEEFNRASAIFMERLEEDYDFIEDEDGE